MTILNHTLGFPRVGLRRELKKAQRELLGGELTREELLAVGRELRARHWDQQSKRVSTCCRWAILLVRSCADHQSAAG